MMGNGIRAALEDSPIISAELSDSEILALEVSFQGLDVIAEIDTMPNLIFLDIRGNCLTSLPAKIPDLKCIQQVLAGSNRIASLPQNWPLTQLRKLDISNNGISVLPTYFLSSIPMLSQLDISRNIISTIPVSISALSSLTNFDASHNRIKTLPSIFSQLKSMQVMDLSANLIKKIPDTVFDSMTSLSRLFLQENPLEELPSISDCISLLTLDISDTSITQLPRAIAYLPLLTTLHCESNRLIPQPTKILDFTACEDKICMLYMHMVVPTPGICAQGLPAIRAALRKSKLS